MATASTKAAEAAEAAAKSAKEKEVAARKLQREAEKAAASAKRQKEAEKKAAAAAKEKEKKQKEKARFEAATLKALEKDAKDINGRFAVIERSEKKTDDHRLAAAILIASAKERCGEAKINFKAWCEENLRLPPREQDGEPRKLSYETIRKLAPVGQAENDEEGSGLLMLEDMRNRNAEANRAKRERDAADTPPKANSSGTNKIRSLMDDLPEEEWEDFMESQAKTAGKAIVDSADADDLRAKPIDRAKAAFNRLPDNQKEAFAEWVDEQLEVATA